MHLEGLEPIKPNPL